MRQKFKVGDKIHHAFASDRNRIFEITAQINEEYYTIYEHAIKKEYTDMDCKYFILSVPSINEAKLKKVLGLDNGTK